MSSASISIRWIATSNITCYIFPLVWCLLCQNNPDDSLSYKQGRSLIQLVILAKMHVAVTHVNWLWFSISHHICDLSATWSQKVPHVKQLRPSRRHKSSTGRKFCCHRHNYLHMWTGLKRTLPVEVTGKLTSELCCVFVFVDEFISVLKTFMKGLLNKNCLAITKPTKK